MPRVGVLRDHPGAGGDAFARAVCLGFDDVRAAGRLGHDLELIEEQAEGLPRGSAAAVEAAFGRLLDRDVVAVIGPAITDNGLVVRDLADRARVPCINWTGGEETRSDWMFHYQVGSLEEEPAFLAHHLAAAGLRRVVLVTDGSLVGRRYVAFFDEAAARFGITFAHRVEGAADVQAERLDALVYLGLWEAAHALAVALRESGWWPPVFTNSALMYGHARADWARDWDGWRYVDAYSDRNPILRAVLGRLGSGGVPVAAGAAYDLGRLVAEAVGSTTEPTCEAVKSGLERVKLLPAALGLPGTTMGFGIWDRAALKGRYLVLRRWSEGRSVEVEG
jgi:ABC-type branched-subunit amino acid transport system substrate-binding protein